MISTVTALNDLRAQVVFRERERTERETSKGFVRTALVLASLVLLTDATPASAQQLAMAYTAPIPQVNVAIAGGDDRTRDSRGTAFLVGRDTWVTAAHVVNGCASVYVRVGNEWRPARAVKVHPSADLAVFEARQDDRTSALKLSTRDPSLGDTALHIGFASGEFTSVETRLSAAASVRQLARPEAAVSPGWFWAQSSDNSSNRRLNGVSGGPQLDANGAVQGVTISYAGAPMRITTAPMSSLQGFLPASAQYASGSEPLIAGRGTQHAAQLRANGSVTSVYCASTTAPRSLPRT